MTLHQYTALLHERGVSPADIVVFACQVQEIEQLDLRALFNIAAPDTEDEWNAVFAAYQESRRLLAQMHGRPLRPQ